MPAIIAPYITLEPALFFRPAGDCRSDLSGRIRQRLSGRAPIRIAMVNLRGIPAVVYGFSDWVCLLSFSSSAEHPAASLSLSIMTLPGIISTTEEALRTVPTAFHPVASSLGVLIGRPSGALTCRKVYRNLTGIILGLERAAGEQRHFVYGCCIFLTPLPTHRLMPPWRCVHLFVISTQVPGDAKPDPIWYGTGTVALCCYEPDATIFVLAHAPGGSGGRLTESSSSI